MGFTIGLRRAGLRIPAKIFQPPGFGEWILGGRAQYLAAAATSNG